MASAHVPSLALPKTYAELRRAVEVAMIHGQRAVELAIEMAYFTVLTGRTYFSAVCYNLDMAKRLNFASLSRSAQT